MVKKKHEKYKTSIIIILLYNSTLYSSTRFKSKKIRLGVVGHTYNPNYLGGRDQEDNSLSSAQEKVNKTPNQKISWVCWYASVIPLT
jgi:hypothetical protein